LSYEQKEVISRVDQQRTGGCITVLFILPYSHPKTSKEALAICPQTKETTQAEEKWVLWELAG